MKTIINTLTISSLALLLACGGTTETNGDSEDPVGTVPSTRRITPPDRDRDGVPDGRDRCDTPILESTEAGVYVQAHVDPRTGCNTTVLPRACRADSSPPKALFGLLGAKNFVAGATVRLVKLNGKSMINLRMEDTQDVDIVEDCPEMDSYMFAAVRVGQKYGHWMCSGLQTRSMKDLGNGLVPVREITIDDRNPCYFVPSAFGITDQEMAAAESSGDIQLVLEMFVRDGAMNQLRTSLGEGTLGGGTCGFTTFRDGYNQAATTSSENCTNVCSTAPVITLGQRNTNFPPPVGTSGGESVVFKPRVLFQQRLTVTANASCGTPIITAYATAANAGDTVLATEKRPLPCTVSAVSPYTVSCLAIPHSVVYRAGAGEPMAADISIAVRTGSAVSTLETSVHGHLP